MHSPAVRADVRSKSMAWGFENRISWGHSHGGNKAWQRCRIFICASPQEHVNEANAGATGYFVAIYFKHFLSALRPGTPNVILIAATLDFFLKHAAIARLLRGVILYNL